MSWKGHRKTNGCVSKSDYVTLKDLNNEREENRFMMRVRLAKRDLDYAESPYAAPVTADDRGNRVIETRGRCCIAPRITHLG